MMASVPLVGIGLLLLLLLSTCHYSEGCGWNTTALTGTVQSPNFPSNYSNFQNCVYIIKAPVGYRVTLTFTDFDIEPAPQCRFDFIEMRDGNNTASPFIGRYCNSSLPSPKRTFSNQMWIRFVSDLSTTRRGFRATFASAQLEEAPFFLIASSVSGSSSGGAIHRMDVETKTNYIVPMKETLYVPVAVDYDPVEQTIYWSEVGQTKGIRASSLDGSGMRTVLYHAAAHIDGLAVDAWTREVFYTDTGRDLIAKIAMSSDATHTIIINSGLLEPRAIVLDTEDEVMFWTDWGSSPKIERANYNGSARSTLVSTGLYFANGLALDMQNDALYWVDAGTDRVETCDTQGGNRRALLTMEKGIPFHFFDVAYLNGFLYITDWNTGPSTTASFVFQLEVATATNLTLYGATQGRRLNGIHVHDPGLFTDLGTLTTRTTTTSTSSPTTTSTSRPTTTSTSRPTTTSTSRPTTISTSRPTTTSTSRPTTTSTSGPKSSSTTRSGPSSTPSLPIAFPAVVTTTDPQPFDTDGEQEMTLSCDHDPTVDVISYDWNVPCTARAGRTCIFKPRPAEDDGQVARCTATSSGGHVASGELMIHLNYPPQDPPTIQGHSKDKVYKEGDGLRMTCSVHGGKPVVTAVFFSCGTHPDSDPDIIGTTEVHSVLTIDSLTASDDGQMCTCTATWKDTDWYKLSATAVLMVNGTSEGTSDSIIAIAAGSAAAGVVVIAIIIIIIIVCIIKRRKAVYEKPRRKQQTASQENPYSSLEPPTCLATAPPSGQPFIINSAFEADQCSIYNEIADDPHNSKYATLDDMALGVHAVSAPPLGDYLTPASANSLKPVPCRWDRKPAADSYIHATSNPTHDDYVTPKPSLPKP